MPLFIRPPDRKDYGTLAIGPEGEPIWRFRGPFNAQDTRDMYSRPVTEADFTNESTFFEADNAFDLNWCDFILEHNLITAFITPDGRFFSFTAHEAFTGRLLKPALGDQGDVTAATKGWLRISHQAMGFLKPDFRHLTPQKTGMVTHCWHHVSDRDVTARLTRAQIRTLEKIGYSAADKEQKTNFSYEDVFGDNDTPGMKILRETVAESLKNKHRHVDPAIARQIVQDYGRGRGTKPSDPGPG